MEETNATAHELNKARLVRIFESGSKKERMFGVELEHILLHKNTGLPVSYAEPGGVGDILERLSPDYDEKVYEDGKLVGLARPGEVISIEAAAQLEISAGPFAKVEDVERAYLDFRERLGTIIEEFGLATPMMGYNPSACAAELELVPKARYRHMTRFLGAQSPAAVCMMRGTASVQVSIDYADEADALCKLRIAQIIAPVLSLITDNSPIFEQAPRPHHMVRAGVYADMRQDRVGTVPGSLAPGYSFADYADFLLSREAILVPDGEGGWEYVADKTFDEVYSQREMDDAEAEHALSMVWPDVRLKRFLEIRPADAMPFDYSLAYIALIKGLFYNKANLAVLEALTAEIGEDDVLRAKRSLMAEGYAGWAYGRPVAFWIDELLLLASGVLRGSDAAYLEPLEAMTRNRFTLADAYQDPKKRESRYKEVIHAIADETGAPRIGILPRYDFELTGISLGAGYTTGVLAAGGLPIVLPLTDNPRILDKIIDECDGFIVPGGQDIDPDFYGQKRNLRLQRVCRQRDEMELALIPRIIAADKPILGICRGMQALNVAMDGTLFQDIHLTHPDSTIRHVQKRPYTHTVHDVDTVPGTMLAAITGASRFSVNTIHHQSVKTPGRGMVVSAHAPDGVVEAVEMPGKRFVLGVQWHPEHLWRVDSHALTIFKALVNAASAVEREDAPDAP